MKRYPGTGTETEGKSIALPPCLPQGRSNYGSGYNPYKIDFPADHSSCNKRVLRIPDFITKNRDAHDDEDVDEVVKGGRLLIRKYNKPKVSDVTLPEWTSVNARILKKLIEQTEIVSSENKHISLFMY